MDKIEKIDKSLEEVAEEYGNVKHPMTKTGAKESKEDFIAGAGWQKSQIFEDGIDCEVKIDAGGYPYIERTIELYDYEKDEPLAKKGDKYKLVLLKVT